MRTLPKATGWLNWGARVLAGLSNFRAWQCSTRGPVELGVSSGDCFQCPSLNLRIRRLGVLDRGRCCGSAASQPGAGGG